MKKFRVGILGMGYIGESHIEAVRRIGQCQLYAVADTNAGLAREKAEQYGVDRCCSSVDELLNDPKVDVIHNCTPNFLHAQLNCRILRAGKHLFSEKTSLQKLRRGNAGAASEKGKPRGCGCSEF